MRCAALPRSFFSASAEKVAPHLLGHWLIRRTSAGLSGGPIVEVEAYLHDDPACHSFGGKSARNRAMWGEPGRAYVYLIYGYHFCFNAVCHEPGVAEAVLVRAIEPEFSETDMLGRRPVPDRRNLTNGPAKLCSALEIDRDLDGADLCEPLSEVFIARNPQVNGFLRRRGPIITTTRIGISKAAQLPLRFYLEKSLFVSKRKRVTAKISERGTNKCA